MRDRIDKILGNFLALLMGIMTLDVLWGVFTRYAMGSQASWTEELARFLLIWIGILGAAYAAGKNMHLSIDLLMPKLQEKGKKQLYRIISLLIIAFAFTVMVIGGIRLIYITQVLGQLSPALRIPMAVVYSVVPLSGILVIYYKASNMVGYDQLHQ
ncbi:MAG: TRAP transporter small permease [Lewinellaceae bacterium]|nr:TRAP transporter small permease [Phaeodactylibacter sp.]MCB9040985.1 TRAP transporter small permease [Lewinellaceae bacterium]